MQPRRARLPIPMRRGSASKVRPRNVILAIAVLAALIVPAIAIAHIERASYWPNPAPDRSAKPPAGGKVPKARSLASALDASKPGDTRVVCKSNSLALLKKSIRKARNVGA